MVGTGGHTGGGAIVVALLVAGASLVPSASAAAAGATAVLPGSALGAQTVDLDGDGAREVVRLISDENGADQAVDAWTHDGSGWERLGTLPVPVAAGDGADPPSGGVASALLRWRDGDRERLLLASAIVDQESSSGETCCLSLFEVHLSPSGIESQLLQQIGGGAQYIQTADIDADGTDDLVLQETSFGEEGVEPVVTLTVHRWSGSAFESVLELTDRALLNGVFVAESDGVAGTDVLFGPIPDGRLHRLSWENGEMLSEDSAVDTGGPPEGWISGAADHAIVLSLPAGVNVLRWPRGATADVVTRIPMPAFGGVAVVGDGPDALLAFQDGSGFEPGEVPITILHSLDGRRLGEVEVGSGSAGFWRVITDGFARGFSSVQRNIYPYMGPMHDGLGDDKAAYISSGMLIRPGGPDGYEARSMGSLIGMQPLGLAGPDDGWAVLGDSYGAFPGTAYLTWGGVPFGSGRVVVTPLAELLRPDGEVEVASVDLTDAVEVSRTGADIGLLADGDGFQATVSAVPGSTVLFGLGGLTEEHATEDGPVVLEVEPRRNGNDRNEEFDALLLVIGPDGRGMGEQWTGTFVRELPELAVRAETTTMALSATLEGSASPGSVVTANGVPIEVDGEGRFSASVDAPIWPSQVTVAARDPLGNETVERVEVIGAVDYRGLPWAALLIVATLGVGGALYVRAPKRRPRGAAEPDGDGRLEELELDPLDGVDRRVR